MATEIPRVVTKPRMANKGEVATYPGISRRKAGDAEPVGAANPWNHFGGG